MSNVEATTPSISAILDRVIANERQEAKPPLSHNIESTLYLGRKLTQSPPSSSTDVIFSDDIDSPIQATEVKKRKTTKATKRREPVLSDRAKDLKRLASNDRERERRHTLNNAYKALKCVTPQQYFERTQNHRKQDSKLRTLLAATEAITDLLLFKKDTLNKNAPSPPSTPEEAEENSHSSDSYLRSVTGAEEEQLKRNIQPSTPLMTPRLIPYEQVPISWKKAPQETK